VFGEFPYFESAFLGGGETMRTLHRQQYAGDRSLYGTVELRLPVASFPFILPLNVGLLGFSEAGRVYMDGASPGGWHSAMGGGFWLGTMKPSTNVNFTWTNSRDRKFLIATGFLF
jgi:hemolysin activation/secretion protein